ncbi:unnamed protein product, partial [Rotaria magnacalcarata]
SVVDDVLQFAVCIPFSKARFCRLRLLRSEVRLAAYSEPQFLVIPNMLFRSN